MEEDWLTEAEDAYERKRLQAVAYLQERMLWRGQSQCEHKYRSADETRQVGLKRMQNQPRK